MLLCIIYVKWGLKLDIFARKLDQAPKLNAFWRFTIFEKVVILILKMKNYSLAEIFHSVSTDSAEFPNLYKTFFFKELGFEIYLLSLENTVCKYYPVGTTLKQHNFRLE